MSTVHNISMFDVETITIRRRMNEKGSKWLSIDFGDVSVTVFKTSANDWPQIIGEIMPAEEPQTLDQLDPVT